MKLTKAEGGLTLATVEAECGFGSCYGCGKCTSGCPVAERMEITPHQMMRLLQLGEIEELLAATAPWLCVGCQTCLARCPNKVDIPLALAQIRSEALKRGITANAGNIPFFDDLLLGMIERSGRVNDGMMAFRYQLHAGGLLNDWRIGLKMFRAGKMKLRVPGVVDTESVKKLFDEVSTSSEETK